MFGTTFGRRRTLRAAGALAGLGLAASLGGAALAQQAGGMGGMDHGGMMGGGAQAGGMMGGGGQAGGMMGGMPGMMQAGMQGMMPMMAELMGPEADRAFIREMIPHHQAATAMAMIAWQQAEHPEIKQLTEMIVKAPNEEVEQMARLHRAWFGSDVPPGHMPAMMARMGMTPDALRGARPADKAFIDMMSMHHNMAVMMATTALAAHKQPELARIQEKIVTDQAKEIAQMRAWHLAWYGA